MQYACKSGFFFHRFCGNKHNRFSETLSLGGKSLSLGEKSLSLGKILEFRRYFLRFYTEKLHFYLKFPNNFRIFEFRCDVYLSLAKKS